MATNRISDLVRQVEQRIAVQEGAETPSQLVTATDNRPQPSLQKWPHPKNGIRFVLGVTTYNRLEYLQRFVETFSETRSNDFDWVLIVADDGSTDGTVEYLHDLEVDEVVIIKIYNKAARIAGQTNSILLAADAVDFDFGIKCDDDVYFSGRGWDTGYYRAAVKSGFGHLVYHNSSWKSTNQDQRRGDLRSQATPEEAMGCLWTFTPRVLDDVGFFDERAFPVRGHSHLDFTTRAVRMGFNQAPSLWDWAGSGEVVEMWKRDEYVNTIDWRSREVRSALTPESRREREQLIADDRRGHLSFDPLPGRPLPVVETSNSDDALLTALWLRGFAPTGRGQLDLYDQAFVLNLPHHLSRWHTTASRLSKVEVSFARADTVNGYAAESKAAWHEYAAEGPKLPIEHRIGRKLIESPGAWGYLSSALRVIKTARESRMNRVLMLDDDIMLASDFDERLSAVILDLPDKWRVVYLGASYHGEHRGSRVTAHLVDPGDQVNGSFSVAIHSSVFEQIEESVAKREWPFDSGALREVREEHPGEVLAARPEIVIADVSDSSIRRKRDLDSFADKNGWRLDDFAEQLEQGDQRVVSLLIWGSASAVGLRETLRSIRYQRYGWFQAFVLINREWTESRKISIESRVEDPRITILEVDTEQPTWGFGAAKELITGTDVTHLIAGDILFPDHLERLMLRLAASDAVVPSAFPRPKNSLVSGQIGSSWREIRRTLAKSLEADPRPTRVLLSERAAQEVGDIPAWNEHSLGEAWSTLLEGRLAQESDPTMIATPGSTQRTSGSPDPFHLSKGRELGAHIVRKA